MRTMRVSAGLSGLVGSLPEARLERRAARQLRDAGPQFGQFGLHAGALGCGQTPVLRIDDRVRLDLIEPELRGQARACISRIDGVRDNLQHIAPLRLRQHDGGHTDAPNVKYFIQWADKNIGHTR